MKELSIVRQMVADGQISQEVAEKYFPELKESEDERIKKIISDILLIDSDDIREILESNNVLMQDIDAWLEKQDGSKFSSWRPTKEQYEALDYAYNSCSDTERGNYYEGVLETLIDDLHRLEKQGEQKPATDFSDLRTWKYIVDAVWTEKEGIGQYLDSPFTEEVAKKLQKRFGNIEPKSVDKYKEWYGFIRWFVKQRTDDYTLIPSDEDIHKWGDNILNHARKVLE